MSVKIRLARHGRKKLPFYRIVVQDSERARNGRFLERVGTVNPLKDPAVVEMKEDRIKHWVELGAKPTDTVAQIIQKQIPGYLEEIEKNRLEKSAPAAQSAKNGQRPGPRGCPFPIKAPVPQLNIHTIPDGF